MTDLSSNLFSVTAPLTLRLPDGSRQLMVRCFPHPDGLLWLEPYWHLQPDKAIHVQHGELKGDGPWKIGEAVVTVSGCHGADPQIAMQLSDWNDYLLMHEDEYPDENTLRDIARKYGASV